MREPPEFIQVTDENYSAIRHRCDREAHYRNGVLHAASDGFPSRGDTVAFPWPDAITQLGNILKDVKEVERLRIEPNEMLWVKVNTDRVPNGSRDSYMMEMRKILSPLLERLGVAGRVLISANDQIDLKAISVIDLLKLLPRDEP